MTDPTDTARTTETYRESLRVPLSWWFISLAVAGLSAATLHNGAGGWRAVVPYATLLPLTVVGLLVLSRQRIVVDEGVLRLPGARAPLTTFGPAELLTAQELREWLGIRAHTDAWVQVKPWSKAAVRLPVTDPDDDTPYWLVGTRHPVDLAVALAPIEDLGP